MSLTGKSRMPESAGASHLYLREDEVRAAYEALMRAQRMLARLCDEPLQAEHLGSAHHRVLFLLATHPGYTMSMLLKALHVTKQSLSRVLQDLVGKGYVERRGKSSDRRLRLLYLTERGALLERELFARQRERMSEAYRQVGGMAVEGFRRVLSGLAEGDSHE